MKRKVKLFALPEKNTTKVSSPSKGEEQNSIGEFYLGVGKLDEFLKPEKSTIKFIPPSSGKEQNSIVQL